MKKIIVTADIEVHTKVDVSNFEIRGMFREDDHLCEIIEWIDKETDRVIDFVADSLGVKEIKDNTLVGVYGIKKNVTLKPIEE